ncbi:hypothetical protein [Anaerotignum sp. MB30-C6]|uniref:hypothetical protein n=1 Tax=Anaerotignum sp. MB30-C6 TaxID=3070814 RepID=UPI0027DB014B|nr:hypothetical protein [Anaerotignum sp. MB30-C6]WMI80893.1 hypothetical protein RBQ60_13900 [Anaerotignum sp. MB30-C6]
MAQYTTNYNLVKPADNETADIAVINANMDKIDTAIAEAGNNPQLEADVAEIKQDVGTTVDTGGSEAGGTIFGKLNRIIQDILGMITNLGKPTDTGATVTTGSMFAKLNSILSKGCVKSVQCGTVSMDSVTKQVTISQVDLSKSFVLINFYSGSFVSYSTIDIGVAVHFSNSTTLNFRSTAYTYYTTVAHWQVIEFY